MRIDIATKCIKQSKNVLHDTSLITILLKTKNLNAR